MVLKISSENIKKMIKNINTFYNHLKQNDKNNLLNNIQFDRKKIIENIKKYSQQIIYEQKQITKNSKQKINNIVPHSRIWSKIKKDKNNKSKICFYCYKKLTINNITEDHKIARGLGGNNKRSNKVYSCVNCNNIKSSLESKILNQFNRISFKQHINTEHHIDEIAKAWFILYIKFHINLPISIVDNKIDNIEYNKLIYLIKRKDIKINISNINMKEY